MEKLILVLSISLIFSACAKYETASAQTQSNENITYNSPNKESVISVQNPSPRKKPKWIAGSFKGLQLGKSTVKDVERIFGKPKYITHPEDEYDNPVESRLDYVYDNEPQIIIDKKSGIVTEIWGGDFSTFEEALEKYGNDFYEVEFTEKGCVFKAYKEKQDKQDRLNIAYPQYGFYFYLNDKMDVIAIYYVDKCG